MSIPQGFIQELVARTDVVEVVGRHVQLKKGGANFMGLCPFHNEKSPSFTVSPSKQFYHCFGCGKNGNAIGFLMDYVGMSFVEAVHDLSQRYGMPVPQDDSTPEERARASEQRQRQSSLSELLERAAESYKKQLRDSPRVIEYCKGRGLSGEVAAKFDLGYAPAGWRNLASVFPNYDDPLLVESGLTILATEDGEPEKRYDRFRDRLMFPIRNIKGDCIGFGGRVLGDGKPKYLNSPETPVFSKGRELYGLFEARTAIRELGYALVTEGYMDVVALAQLGFPNAVATLGTACTTDHIQKLFRFTDSIVFSFDGDAAGRRAARKALDCALPFASDVRSIKFLYLPAEHDPDSFIREFGQDAFARCVAGATPLSRFLIDAARESCDLTSAEGRAQMASHAKPLWLPLPDGALKRQLLIEIAELVHLASDELVDLWNPERASQAQHRPTPDKSRASPPSEHHHYHSPQPQGMGSRRARGHRPLPVSRADHAARLLLGGMTMLDRLSAEDHTMLCELPAPHGPLFVWLEGQLHEHGTQSWMTLREGLRGHPDEELALRLMSDHEMDGATSADSSFAELRDLLDRMLIERLKSQETEAIQRADTDPSALKHYRELQTRRRQIEAMLGTIRH